jgi:ubiquinone/menaquinone biosynthesis C-methylase UbiE
VGFYEEHVLPRVFDKALGGKAFGRVRARALAGLEGDVVEIGFGSGTNVPYIPPGVTKLWAVDPATVGRKLAKARIAASTTPIEFVGLDGQQLPLADNSVDHALSTWTLCTIPDPGQALAEIQRVLRPGGTLHFLEHGHSPDPAVARWQERLTPLQRKLFGGCHLNRSIDELVTGVGLDIRELTNFYMRGPKFFGYMYAGVAAKS